MRTSHALRGAGILCSFVFLAALHAGEVAARIPNRASMAVSDKSLPALRLTSYIVNATVSGRVARVSTESVYHNDSPRDLEATYVFPLPEGATVEKFTMWMDGQPVDAQVAEKDRARATYERIVNQRKDPGLIEQLAENLFRMRIFPVRANSDQRVRIEYSQVLRFSSDLNSLTFNYPLYSAEPLDAPPSAHSFVMNLALEMESPIAKLESPTHKISQRIFNEDPKRGTVSIEENQVKLDRDFTLTIGLKDRALPVTTLAYRAVPAPGQDADDGALMLFITPQLPANETLPAKDVVLVMDTSGSMEGQKIQQARTALNECLSRLQPKDRFALVSFSDFSKSFSDQWASVNPDSVLKGKAFVNALVAAGGTNIGEALERALAFPTEDGRIKQILFATDGLPTVGLHEPSEICKLAVASGKGQRIFTLGIGYDVNPNLLDRLAADTRGARAYVRENERIDEKVGILIDKISSPVMTDVSVEFSSPLGIEQVYPPKIGDLYLGQQLILTARYKHAGPGQVVLKGKRNGKEVVIEAPLNLPETTVQATAFVMKQWAMRKTGYLLDQIRLYGENAELKSEVVRLGTQFGIATPYTSFLALEANARAQLNDHVERFQPNDITIPPHSVDAGVGGGGAGASGGGWSNGTGSPFGDGTGRGSFGNRNGGGRRLMVKRHGGSKATENTVDNALRWLAYHQEAEGHWDSRKYGSEEKIDTAVTSLALLAFLGAGHTEKVGEYKDNVKRAIAWLKSRQSPDGRIFDPADSPNRSAELGNPEALAALALAEASAMATIVETRTAAQNAIDYCVRIQKAGSGWGNDPQAEPNLIATTWFIMAMKSAKVAGLHVEFAAFDNALKFLDSMERKLKGAAVTYAFSATENGSDFDAPRAAMGTLARQFLGWKKEDLQETVAAFIERGGLPKWSAQMNTSYLYFGTLCAFQQGGDIWKNWNENLKTALVENQGKDGDDAGSWKIDAPHQILGRAGQTAIFALCVEVYYRYQQLTPGDRSTPSVNAQPMPDAQVPESGKQAVDYSEYIRKLQEGEGK